MYSREIWTSSEILFQSMTKNDTIRIDMINTEFDKNWRDINWDLNPLEVAKKEKERHDEILRMLG